MTNIGADDDGIMIDDDHEPDFVPNLPATYKMWELPRWRSSDQTSGGTPPLNISNFKNQGAISSPSTDHRTDSVIGQATSLQNPFNLFRASILDEDDPISPRTSNTYGKARNSSSGLSVYSPSPGKPPEESIVLDSDQDGETLVLDKGIMPESAHIHSKQLPIDGHVIDLDLLEDDNHFLEISDDDSDPEEDPDVQFLSVRDVFRDADTKGSSKKGSKAVKYEYRNPPIIHPLTSIDSYSHNGVQLRTGKTVELQDGDFLRITHLIHDLSTSDLKLRGHRLQRVRDFNGMLEKKLNEICLCYEIDLDDPRPPQEQGLIEVPLSHITKLRNVRFTNQSFPHCRNVQVSDFASQNEASDEGGLTARWKSTATFATAADRHLNVYKERTLEHIGASETTGRYAVSDDERRREWRGETVRGGAYRLALGDFEVVDLPEDKDWRQSAINVRGNSSEPEIIVLDALPHEYPSREGVLKAEEGFSRGSTNKRKRSSIGTNLSYSSKKSRMANRKARNCARDVTPNFNQSISRKVSTWRDPSPEYTPSPSPTPGLLSSSISTPPYTGSLRSHTSPQQPIRRSPNQKLTYGDAFCGAGGTTRGALQAGLHIKWGFDFNATACTTWRTNFPSAHCFHLPSHEFVSIAQSSPNPHLMKVDILHLSPPCQFFSPAHTIEGPDDEMNTASLFAVQTVIGVAKPRVVTLEQTFGIACTRFRFYFNALIQMFTVLDFSVRWAIVPLCQWRRTRLIIIASCPGEILPSIPPPTHGPMLPLPLVTVNAALANVPLDAADHKPGVVRIAPRLPWNGDKIGRTVTTHGANYHPSGERDFTIREYAALQGFPTEHVFEGSYVKKQIGNAVPPLVAKLLFESIVRELDEVDGVAGEEPMVID